MFCLMFPSSVLFVPKFPVNLVFVNKLTKLLDCSVTFFAHYCVFKDLKMKKMIGGDREMNSLYYINVAPEIQVFHSSSSLNPFQWHCHQFPFFL
jgi:hypothetical protein